jgi:aryl-alcohol dehydrogenase-like predicted oxidoreductase
MEYRSFGATGIRVSALGMGCSRLGAFWQGQDDRTSLATIGAALHGGMTFFDTADGYGRGRSEAILGRAVRSRREQVTIATKCGLIKTPSALANAVSAELSRGNGRHLPNSLRSVAGIVGARRTYSAAYVRRAAISSLRRLRTPYLDVFLLHSPPDDVFEDPEFIEGMEELKRRGLIRTWGVSVGGTGAGLQALALPGIGSIEVELNLCKPDAAGELVPRAATQGVAVIARQPFGSGRLLEASDPVAGRDGARPTQGEIVGASLQFALRSPGVATVIAGMSRPHHVERNVQAAGGVISDEEMERVRSLVCPPGS